LSFVRDYHWQCQIRTLFHIDDTRKDLLFMLQTTNGSQNNTETILPMFFERREAMERYQQLVAVEAKLGIDLRWNVHLFDVSNRQKGVQNFVVTANLLRFLILGGSTKSVN
jgi:hypothetical protein